MAAGRGRGGDSPKGRNSSVTALTIHSPASVDSVTRGVVWPCGKYLLERKNLHVSGFVWFTPVLFKGQLYYILLKLVKKKKKKVYYSIFGFTEIII